MSIHRSVDGSEPLRPQPVEHVSGEQEQRLGRAWRLATGTLACPSCDAPVAPANSTLSPTDPLRCPYCLHAGPVREFLSLEAPSRPARVEVRVVDRTSPAPALRHRR